MVEGGLLRTEGGMGLLWYTREKLGNCVIRVVYRTTARASNSGVFVRIAEQPANPWYAVHHGYEVQIQDAEDELHRTGAIYSLAPAKGGAAKPAGEWNVMEITLTGPRIVVDLNRIRVTEFDPSGPVPERKKIGSRSVGRGLKPDTWVCRTTGANRPCTSRK